MSDPERLGKELGATPSEQKLIRGLLRLGAQPDDIREAATESRLGDAIFDGVLDPERRRRTVSAAEIEAAGGLPVAETQAVLSGFGLPVPDADEPYFTEEEASAFRRLGELEDVWPPEVRRQVARVYGQALARVAQTEAHLFLAEVRPKIEGATHSPLQGLVAVRGAFEQLLPLADPMLRAVHRRKLEHELTQAAVWEVEHEAEGLVPGSTEVSLLFCDLRHFTEYMNRHGDAAAIEALDHLAGAVEESLVRAGRLVKALGDGYLLAYPEPAPAVAEAQAIASSFHEFDGLAIHAGLHHGAAVYRDGDYYGRTVNLAARLLSVADHDELLATSEVVAAAPGYGWRSLGRRRLRGFADDLEVFRLDLRSADA